MRSLQATKTHHAMENIMREIKPLYPRARRDLCALRVKYRSEL